MTPSAKTTYRAYFAGDADYPPAASTSKVVLPRPRLTRSTNWLTLLLSKTYYFRGYIEPRHASAEPKLVVKAYKRRRDGSYPAMTSPTATFSGGSFSYYNSTKSAYAVPLKLTSAGTWRLYVYHPADARNAAAYWGYDTVTVR